MNAINDAINTLNGVLFSDYTVYALLIVGLLFTVWSVFGQYRALTHGVQVVRGKFDDRDDPGAINHFQALSAALSATVGLGNIAGVALAVALGGPGAVLWMWLIGLLGMALKMTEVTQSMLYRNTDDPENPHGGPMFVVKKGLTESRGLRWPAAVLFALVSAGLGTIGYLNTESMIALVVGGLFAVAFLGAAAVSGGTLGSLIGGVFVVTLITSAITGGNMFQAWNVADITYTYFQVPQVVTGIVLAIVVGLVIIGGIKRIGSVAGKIVPFMCVLYVLAALYVLALNIGEVPAMLLLIVQSGLPDWLGGAAPDATGAFLGGTFGYAAMWGVKRALFSSEAGQGSSPIAHSAAKTDEPVREGVVAGLEPFIDTIVVCTLTALVILSSGAYNREAEAEFEDVTPSVVFASEPAGVLEALPSVSRDGDAFVVATVDAPDYIPTPAQQSAIDAGERDGADWADGSGLFAWGIAQPGERRVPIAGRVDVADGATQISFTRIEAGSGDGAITSIELEPTLYHGEKPGWKLDVVDLPRMTADARRIRQTPSGEAGWRDGELIFAVVEADFDNNTGRDLRRLTGTVQRNVNEADDSVTWSVEWNPLRSNVKPFFRTNDDGTKDVGLYGDYAGASLTAYAFDRVTPGLGKILVSVAAWLFAVSTMISWSYYGEQGIYFLFSRLGDAATKSVVLVYKLIYCALVLITCVLAMPIIQRADGTTAAIIGTDAELDMWTTLGLGVMLVANIPIMLIFGSKAMSAYRDYFDRMGRGEDPGHEAPPIVDVAEGKDVE
ncbi:MAG: hypothetical protein Tsb0013_00590 [Phycisphaerales bacterium]